MTRRFSKEEILALYLNQVNYGGMAYGAEAAAQTYLQARCQSAPAGVRPAGWSAAGPGLYNPFTNPDLAKERPGYRARTDAGAGLYLGA